MDASVEIPLLGQLVPKPPSWANYVRGVVVGCIERGITPPSLDALLVSDIPLGGGLSSSAALEVACATLFEEASGQALDKVEKARLCQAAEHRFANVPCGLMDQLASACGDSTGALLIDCESETFRVVKFADPSASVLVCGTNVKHSLANSEYSRRRADCHGAAKSLGVTSLRHATLAVLESKQSALGEIARKRARHVIAENQRTQQAADAFEQADYERVGELMYESHHSLRTDFEVSCYELDVLVDSAKAQGLSAGVYGARMTGGGFGGSAVMLVRTKAIEEVSRALAADYTARTGRVMSSFVSHPTAGARRLDPSGLTSHPDRMN